MAAKVAFSGIRSTMLRMHYLALLGLFTSILPLYAGVNPDGSFSHSIPIEIPPGRNGIQPQLALTYNSNQGNGMVGVGWSLQGISAITRMNYGRGINYDGQDTYAGPDGRLIAVQNSPWAEYVSENATWSKFEALGWDFSPVHIGNRCGGQGALSAEPCIWRVTDRNGIIYLYGATDNSRIMARDQSGNPLHNRAARGWALTRVIDLNGNSYEVEYSHDAGQYYPKQIRYTLGAGVSKSYAVSFFYDEAGRSDRLTNYSHIAHVQTNWRVSKIAVDNVESCFLVFTCSQRMRAYELQYYAGFSGVSKLSQLRTYDNNDSLSSRLQFTWQDNDLAVQHDMYSASLPDTYLADGNGSMGTEVKDVTGDGLPDLIQLFIPPGGYYGGQPQHRVFKNTGRGFAYEAGYSSSLPDTYFADGNGSMGTRLIDLTGDGLPDLIQMYVPPSGYYGGQPQRRVFRNSATGFTYDHNFSASLPDTYFGMGTEVIDVNGDNLPDLIQLYIPPSGYYGGQPQRRVFRNSGQGFVYDHEYSSSLPDTYLADGNGSMGTRLMDLTGDGRPELIQLYVPPSGYYGGQPQRRVFRNTGSEFTFDHNYSGSLPDTYFGMGTELIDLNGDGLPEIIQLSVPPGGFYGGVPQRRVFRNTGLGFSYDHTYTASLPDTYFEDGSGSMGTRFADVNGDGLPDLMQMHIPANGYYGGQPQRRVFRNNGSNFEYLAGYSATLPDTYFGMGSEVLDLNGDGLSDLIQLLIPPSGYYGGNVQAKVYTGQPVKQDIMINIESDSGLKMTISYKSASEFESAVCPVQCPNSIPTSVSSQPANFARLLVSSVSTIGTHDVDTISGLDIKTQLFEYFDGRLSGGSPVEQALLGFRRIKITDENSGDYNITTYRQDKPFQGTPIVTRSYLANGTLVSEQQAAPLAQYLCTGAGCTLDPANTAHPVLPRQIRQNGTSITRSYEAGNLKFVKSEHVLAYDSYGNPLQARARQESGANVQETFVFRQFINNITSTRAIGVPFYEKTCLSETECVEGDAHFVGATRFYYDNLPLGQIGQRHLVTRKETFGPTDAGNGWIAETFAYNIQGMLEDHRAADGTRTETAYDGNYRSMPANITVSSGNHFRLTTNLYDDRFGKLRYSANSETGTYTEMNYDSVGRMREKIARHSGKILEKTTWQFSAHGEQPAWAKECTHYSTGGSDFNEAQCVKKFADALGRTYREEFPEFVNGAYQQMAIERRYDARGREIKVSRPFTAEKTGCAGTATAGANPTTCEWNTTSYDDLSRVTQSTSFNNKTTTIEYPTTGLPFTAVTGTVTTSPDGKKQGSFQNIYGKVATSYQALHDLNRVTTVRYRYDSRGRLEEVIAPQGTTLIGYVGHSSLQKFIHDPVAGLTEYTYYLTPGRGDFGKLKTEARGGYITNFEYNATFGRVSKVTKTAAAAPQNTLETTTYTYDQTDKPHGKGRLTTLIHVKDGFTITERYTYDEKGDVTETVRKITHATLALCADADAVPCTQVFGKKKDQLGRTTEMLYPDGKRSEVAYVDDFSSFVKNIRHDGVVYAEYDNYMYDVAPHLGRMRYQNGLTHEYTYFADTGLLKTAKASTSSATLLDVVYNYDSSYHIQHIEDKVVPELSTLYEYDAHGRIKKATRGDATTRHYEFDNNDAVNSSGKLQLKDNRRLTYPADKTYPTSDEVKNSDTGQWQQNQTFTWSSTGNLLKKGPFAFEYDANSMMTKATENVAPELNQAQGDSAETRFFYDHTGQRFLKTHTRNGVMIKTWYLGDGIEFREKYVGVSENNASGTFEAYQTTKYIYGIDDKKIASITGEVKTTQPTATADNLFALADSYSSTTASGLVHKTYYTFYGIYAHDNFGKAMRMSGLSLAALLLILYLCLTPIPSPQGEGRTKTLSFRRGWALSRPGEVTRRATALIMLISFVTVNCGTGNAPGTTPTDLGGSSSPIGTPGDRDTGATPTNTFISALYTGLPVGTVYYSHNHLGSGALVTDSAGNEVFRITYTEYGEIDLANSGKYNPATGEIEHHLADALIAITAVKYTGQEYDPETGFYYYNARYYDPQLGVFTTPDTEFDEAQGSFAFNRHMYVKGNPIMFSDPTGHFFFSISSKGLAFGINLGVGGIGIDIKWDKGFTVGGNIQAGPRLGIDINGLGAGFNASATYGLGYNFGQRQGVSYLSAGVAFTSPVGTIGVSVTASFGYRTGYEGTSAEIFFAYGIGKVSGSVGWDEEGNFDDWRVGVDLFATKGFQTVSIGPSYGKSGFDVNAGYSRDLGGEVARDIRDVEQRISEKQEAWRNTKKEIEDFADDLRIIKKGFDDYGEMSRTILNHNKEMIEDWKRIGRGYQRDGRQLKAAGQDLKHAGRDIGLAFKCLIRGCAPSEQQVRKRTKKRSW